MKSIILKPHELANIDRLSVVVRPFEKQPSDEWTPFRYGEVHKMVDGEFVQPLKIMGWGPCNESGSEAYISPFSPGESAWVKEKWATQHLFDPYIASELPKERVRVYYIETEGLGGLLGRSARSMPQWASRFTIKFNTVEAKQLKDLTNEEIRGNCIKPDMVDSGGQTPWGNWIEVPDYGHPFLEAYDVEPYTWLWLFTVEVKKV